MVGIGRLHSRILLSFGKIWFAMNPFIHGFFMQLLVAYLTRWLLG